MSKIERCYFCGEHVSVFGEGTTDDGSEKTYSVYCPVCGAQGPSCESRFKAIARWNDAKVTIQDKE